jgi:hypothetical protein
MNFTPRKVNLYLAVRVPAAWWCGVRVRRIDDDSCTVSVRHRWFNQNPFRSMYFAVQAMAAEISTGTLLMRQLRASSGDLSMLLAGTEARFTKKARGLIRFECRDGAAARAAVERALASREPQLLRMRSTGLDAANVQVAELYYDWTLKQR